MAVLDQSVQEQLGQLFEGLGESVKLVFFTQKPSLLVVPGRQECPSCEDEQQLLTEIAGLSDKLVLEVHDVEDDSRAAHDAGIDKVPALVLKGPTEAGAVRFFGLPSGYEFSTLIADIVDLSNGDIQLSERTVNELGDLSEQIHIQVFVTPT